MMAFKPAQGKQMFGAQREQFKPLLADLVKQVFYRRPKLRKSALADLDGDLPKGN